MKKIIIFIPSLGGGGAEKNIVNLANYLSKEYKVKIYTIYNESEKKHINLINNKVDIDSFGKKKVISSLFDIYKVIKMEEPELVLTTVAYFSLVFSCIIPILPKKTKYICRETNIPDIYGKSKGFFYKIVSNFIYSHFYCFYDKIICQSNDMLNSIKDTTKISDNNKFIVINNPCLISSSEDFSVKEIDIDGREYIISAGRLTYQKGFDDLIIKYKNSEFYRRNIPLFIAGHGPERDNLEVLIKKNSLESYVLLLGFRDDIDILIKGSIGYVLSSWFEGFPNVLLEAIALGCPILARECPGGINEIVIDSLNGITFTEDNFDEKSKLFLSLDFDRDSIIRDANSRFSPNTIFKKYSNTIEDLF